MQLTTINKIISYLLVGSLAAALLLVLRFDDIVNFAKENGEFLKQIGVLTPLIFLAVAAFLGLVIEGITSCSVRYFLRYLIEQKKNETEKFFFLKKTFSEYKVCSDNLFSPALTSSGQLYAEVRNNNAGNNAVYMKRLAVGIFFEKSNSVSIN